MCHNFVVLLPVLLYRRFFSPLLKVWNGGQGSCRFYPTCSEYALICAERYPLWKAVSRIVGRLLRCHPFHSGGVDEP